MQNQNISSIYLSKCDLINRTLAKDINEISKIDKVIVNLSSSQNKKSETSISSSDMNSHLKILLMFYFMLGINPKISYHREKNLNYQQDEKDNDSSYSYKIILENSVDVEKFIHYFFIENNFRAENTAPKFHSLENILTAKLTVPAIIDQDIDNIFHQNSKDTSIKELNFTVNFVINSKKMSKNLNKVDTYGIFPFWFLA